MERFDESGETRERLRRVAGTIDGRTLALVSRTGGVTGEGPTPLPVVQIPAGEEAHVLDHTMYQLYVRRVIEELAEEGDVVIAGRGAGFILEGREGVFRVRLTASEEFRVETQMERKGLDRRTAQALVGQSDRCRAGYLKRNFHADWEDVGLYNLIINTELTSVEVAAEAIAAGAIAAGAQTTPTTPHETD